MIVVVVEEEEQYHDRVELYLFLQDYFEQVELELESVVEQVEYDHLHFVFDHLQHFLFHHHQ